MSPFFLAAAMPSAEGDIANDRPLAIGFGQHDYFNGLISDLRLYGRALMGAEVSALAGSP